MGQSPNKTMTVRNMGRMLGIKKVESYWLVHKNFFETVLVNGKMRVVTESFEYWYAGQVKYHKVNGPPPGERLKQTTYSIDDIAEILGLSTSQTYDIMKREEVEYVLVDYWKRFPKAAFDEWYRNQKQYLSRQDRVRLETIYGECISMPEAARILDVPRSLVYHLVSGSQYGQGLETVMIGRKRHITKKSFDEWYASQTRYLKPEDQFEGYQKPTKGYADTLKPKPKPPRPISVSANPDYLTLDEAAEMAQVDRSTIVRWAQDEKIRLVRVGSKIARIPRQEFEEYITQWQTTVGRR